MALSPDAQVVVIADGKDVTFFSAESGDKIGAVPGVHAEHITAVRFDKVCGLKYASQFTELLPYVTHAFMNIDSGRRRHYITQNHFLTYIMQSNMRIRESKLGWKLDLKC